MGTWREGPFTGDLERCAVKALKTGNSFHKGASLVNQEGAPFLGHLRERKNFILQGKFNGEI
jgi:hypothetical protein